MLFNGSARGRASYTAKNPHGEVRREAEAAGNRAFPPPMRKRAGKARFRVQQAAASPPRIRL